MAAPREREETRRAKPLAHGPGPAHAPELGDRQRGQRPDVERRRSQAHRAMARAQHRIASFDGGVFEHEEPVGWYWYGVYGRFREEATPGWRSDRGRVFVTLGEPDQLLEPQVTDFSRGRQQLWDYRALNMQLVFYDQTGTGRWRLTQSSEVRFESEFRRRLK